MTTKKEHLITTSIPLIGVTGSTGELGGRVATRLATLGQPQRLLVRNLARAPQLPGAEIIQASYEDGPSMRAALSGVQTLFLVSGYGYNRLEQHYSAIDAALAAGVQRIVYTSFLAAAPLATFTHAREHYFTEQRIRASGCRYTFLRPTFYLDRAPLWFSKDGVIQGPAGNGTITWVSRDDLADVAVAVTTGLAMRSPVLTRLRLQGLPKSSHAQRVSRPPINPKLLRRPERPARSSILRTGNWRPGSVPTSPSQLERCPSSATLSRRSLVMHPRPWLTTSASIQRAISTSPRPGVEPVQLQTTIFKFHLPTTGFRGKMRGTGR